MCKDREREIAKLDWVHLGPVGLDPLEPVPAGGADIIPLLAWAISFGPPFPVSLVLGFKLRNEAGLQQERVIVLSVVKQPDYELYVLRLILATYA